MQPGLRGFTQKLDQRLVEIVRGFQVHQVSDAAEFHVATARDAFGHALHDLGGRIGVMFPCDQQGGCRNQSQGLLAIEAHQCFQSPAISGGRYLGHAMLGQAQPFRQGFGASHRRHQGGRQFGHGGSSQQGGHA